MPARRPCGSCPYRCDVPSGIWAEEEYAKLPRFDSDTGQQDLSVFLCHQQDDRLCAGWVAVHDMERSLGLRIAVLSGAVPGDMVDAICDYQTDVPLFASGREAADHGCAEIEAPGSAAVRTIGRIGRRQARRAG